MHSISHALINGLAGYVLGFEPKIIALLVIAGVVIDLDHFLYYLVTTNKSWRELFSHGARHWLVYQPRLFIFHTFEFNLLVLLLGIFVHPFFIYLLIAFLIHMLMDVYDYVLHLGHFQWVKHWFVTYYVLRYLDRKAREASRLARERLIAARAELARKRRLVQERLRAERFRINRRLSAQKKKVASRVLSRGRVLARRVKRSGVLLKRSRAGSRAKSRGIYARSSSSE